MRESLKAITFGIKALVIGLMFVIVLLSSTNMTHFVDVQVVPPPVPAHCWTGEAPKDVTIPGHVWAVIPGGKSGVFGTYWTGKALDQVTDKGSTFGLTVMGFCR